MKLNIFSPLGFVGLILFCKFGAWLRLLGIKSDYKSDMKVVKSIKRR